MLSFFIFRKYAVKIIIPARDDGPERGASGCGGG